MLSALLPLLQQAAPVTRDTIVTLTMPAERTAFDMASGTLQILVLIAGLVALLAMAASAFALRTAIQKLQDTVDRLATDAKPLLAQATQASDDARQVIQLVRREAEKVVAVTGEVSARLLEVSDEAEERLDRVRALLDVLQDEVESTTISAAATVRGWRTGASAIGDALAGRGPRRRGPRRQSEAPLPWADAAHGDDAPDDEAMDDDAMDDDAIDDDAPDEDRLDPRERPYFT
ncbi:MAG: hypothetical protein MUD17_02330 [Gemmatimonadaceae bacterium]|jgi:hypothetical protein|nr:hypothetical protein [Gemmatimonadaceae bacterium]